MSAIDAVPTDQQALAAVDDQVHVAVAAARALVVQTPQQAEEAVEALTQIKATKRARKEAYDYVVKPFDEQVKKLRGNYKEGNAPLEEADKLVREKLLSYQTDQQQKAREEQERIDSERREREAAAEAERQAATAEAARIEQEAREREAKRQAELREAANERAREISLLSDEELHELLRKRLSEGDPEHAIVRAEIKSREHARDAQERAEQARLEAERATAASVAAASAPAVAVTTSKLKSASGSAGTSKHWVGVVVDPDLVPLEYRPVDQKLINAAVKVGKREIPGVRIEQVDRLAVR